MYGSKITNIILDKLGALVIVVTFNSNNCSSFILWKKIVNLLYAWFMKFSIR